MKKKLLYIFLLAILVSSSVAAQDPLVAELVNRVNKDSILATMNVLTGHTSFWYGAGEYKIKSRNSYDDGNKAAGEYIKRKLRNLGYNVYSQKFGVIDGENVYALVNGTELPRIQVMISAHFDSMPDVVAPGADDNASGTAAVLEAARVFKDAKTRYSLVFALWDNEEQGLLGSKYYARLARERGDSLLAVINIDMIGYDANKDGLLEVHTRNYAHSNIVANQVWDANYEYGIGLKPYIIDPGTTRSDHASFWSYNYSAITMMENFTPINGYREFNPYYHSMFDDMNVLNTDYLFKGVRLAVAAFGNIAAVNEITSVEDENEVVPSEFVLKQNYPNPFNPATTINYTIPREGFVSLRVYDILGNEVAELVNEQKSTGSYNISFNAENLSSGIYFYTLETGGKRFTNKMIYMK
ncbi:MAG: M20/M25/M40 family metallo-hydrolase [Melioribacteraceae bacterium]|nr:M20/M25/M40 family metallo-hydrolase [Melioribacteraceae bacterium]